jgi:mono/diheme cytochrome c family protein
LKQSISFSALAFLLLAACNQQYPQGQRIYEAYCANCHMADGSGLGRVIPPLAGADYLSLQRQNVPCVIRYGSKGGLVVNGIAYKEPMPSARNLNEVELSNLINYINTAWNNDLPETSPVEVKAALEQCADQ